MAEQRSSENIKKSELSKIAPAIAKLELELSRSEAEDLAPM